MVNQETAKFKNQNANLKKDNFRDEFKKRIFKFILRLIKFIDGLSKNDRTCKILGDQLLRSGTSVGGNYFEAKSASSRKDFTNFFTHSLKSANESKFWLSILISADKCDIQEAKELLIEVTEIANVLASSILTLKGKRR